MSLNICALTIRDEIAKILDPYRHRVDQADKKLFREVTLGIPTDAEKGDPGRRAYVGGLQEDYQYEAQQAFYATKHSGLLRILITLDSEAVRDVRKSGAVPKDYGLFEYLRMCTRAVIKRLELGNKPISGTEAWSDGAGAFIYPTVRERVGKIHEGVPEGGTSIKVSGVFTPEGSFWKNPYDVLVEVGSTLSVGGEKMTISGATIPDPDTLSPEESPHIVLEVSRADTPPAIPNGAEVEVIRKLGERITGRRRPYSIPGTSDTQYEYEVVSGFRAQLDEILYEFSPYDPRAGSLMVLRLEQYDI